MKNSIKLIAAGAIALAAFATTSPVQADSNVSFGGNGSKSFVGSMKVGAGKYVSISGVGISANATINPVTFAGTITTQRTNSPETATVVSSTVAKVTNASVILSIFGGNKTQAKGQTLVWIVEGAETFAQGYLAALKTTKSGTTTSYTITPAVDTVFATEFLNAELVVSKKTTTSKGSGASIITTKTTVSSAGIYDAGFDGIPVSGVGTVSEVDVSGGTPELKITVTVPLSGTLLE